MKATSQTFEPIGICMSQHQKAEGSPTDPQAGSMNSTIHGQLPKRVDFDMNDRVRRSVRAIWGTSHFKQQGEIMFLDLKLKAGLKTRNPES